jgi:uncharacterized membrane protein
MKYRIILAVVVGSLAGCAISSGVVSMGKDTYMVAVHDNSPGGNLPDVKIKALKDATKFCNQKNQTFVVTGGYDIPKTNGQAAQAEVQFKCVPR